MNKKQKNKSKGFGLIEMVVGISILAISLVGIGAVAQRSLMLSRQSLQETQASFLLEEGSEVMRLFRDTAWVNIGGLSTTTTYYLTYGSAWATTTTANKIDGIFTRSVTVADVKRDGNGNDDIVSSGVYDPGTKKITVTLSWMNGFATSTKTAQFYLTDI
jgi:prepilin-type N-terminal cleavage/methylation domain-containing protein